RAGRLQAKLNLHLDALATHREALTLLEQTSHPPTNIDNVNGLGKAHINLSQCADAEPLLRQAISLSEQHGYTAGKAEALLALSHCQNHQDHALALRTAQEALALWRSADRPRGVAQAYAAVGEYHLAQNNLTEAAQSYEAALNLWRELRVADEQAEALIILGYIEYRGGAWQNVLAFMTQAQNLLDQEAEPYKMGQISSGLAESFIESGLPEFGLGQYLQALGHYRRSQNPRAVIVTTWGIGKTYFTLKNYEEALAHFRQALAEAEAIKELGIAAMCDDFMGRTYAAMSDPAAAMRHYEAALDSYVRAGNTMAAARVRALMGEVYEQQGRVDKAREHYRSALQTFLALSDHVNQAGTLYALGRMELRRNNLDAAEENLRRAIEVTENMRRVSTSRDLTAAFSATVHERYEKYIECLMRQQEARPARDLAVRAFETSELARARSLAELLRATQTDLAPGLDPELARREKSLRQSLRVKEDYKVALLGRPYEAGELSALEAELARLEAEYRQVAETIRARHPAYERVARPAAWDLQRIQEQVVADDETVLLEYALGADRSYVWAVTRDGMTSHELPPRALIHAAARKVYESLARPPTDAGAGEFDAAARELSGMVLSPVAAHLRKGRVIVVADGALNYIPFQVLPGPGAGDEPLVAGHEIVNAPSASILGELRQEAARRRPAARVLAAFGNPVFASNYAQLKEAGGGRLLAQQAPGLDRWQHVLRDLGLNGDTFDPSVIKPLFYAKRELAHLADVAAGGETFVAADFSATREQLLGADLTQYAIVHFATHGFLDPTRPENSGLVLSTVNRDGQAQDGFVGLQNIYELRAPVDLVVLSACQTALGKDVRGEGLLGLTRGFMYAGASSVVASLWKVDDEATAELMREFYTNMLQKGVAPAAALRAAQNSIRQKPEWRSPYYWAAFTLQGEYRRAIKPTAVAGTKALSLKLAGGAALLLLAGLAWRLRRRLMRPAATLR
ncbi:MAG TPA: CHAT domain-containing protein, partial [Pyrinomonadaceae bacterium]|nr:CHAT domain-containing protein [Pyrinomonadaceae bacterium]